MSDVGETKAATRRMRERRARAVAAGRCHQCCLRDPAPGKRACAKCLLDHQERKRAYRAEGLCQCGRETRAASAKCEACAASAYKHARRKREEAKAARLCTRCYVVPAAPGVQLCEAHLLWSREENAKQRARYAEERERARYEDQVEVSLDQAAKERRGG